MQEIGHLSFESLQQKHVSNGDMLFDWMSVSLKIQLRPILRFHPYCVTVNFPLWFSMWSIYLAHSAVDMHTFVYVYTVRFSLLTPWKRTFVRVITPLILTSALDVDGWSPSHTVNFTPGKEPRNSLIKWQVGTKFLCGRFGRTINILPLKNSNPRPFSS